MFMSRVRGEVCGYGSKTYARVPKDRLSYTDKGNVLCEAQERIYQARGTATATIRQAYTQRIGGRVL